MSTLVAIAVVGGIILWIAKDKYEEWLPIAAVFRYSWLKGGVEKLRLQRLLLLAVGVAIGLALFQMAEIPIGWFVAIAVIAIPVWFISDRKEKSSVSDQQGRIGSPARVSVRVAGSGDPIASAERAVPRWTRSHRLDFTTRVDPSGDGVLVYVGGPTDTIALASITVDDDDDGSTEVVWRYARWAAEANGSSHFFPVLMDLRDEWVANMRTRPG